MNEKMWLVEDGLFKPESELTEVEVRLALKFAGAENYALRDERDYLRRLLLAQAEGRE